MEKKHANCIKGTQGYTLVELITVLAIMGILGTMLVSMLNLGTKFYRTANSTMDNQNNARLAIAYITVKIRQNDVAGGITVDSPVTTNSLFHVLKVKDTSSSLGVSFYIYFDSSTHKLREQSGNTGFNQVMGNGTEITDLSYFDIERYGDTLHFRVTSVDGTVDLAQDITLRSP